MLELSLPAIDTLFDPEILAAVVFLSSFGIFSAFNDRDPAKSRGLQICCYRLSGDRGQKLHWLPPS